MGFCRRSVNIFRRVGRRGSFLLFLALLDVTNAFALATPDKQASSMPAYVFLASILPLWCWAIPWAGVGLLCLFYAFRKNDAVAYGVAMFLKVFWALVFLLGWIFVHVDRGYLSTTVWGAFAAVLLLIATWPEPDDISYGEHNDP